MGHIKALIAIGVLAGGVALTASTRRGGQRLEIVYQEQSNGDYKLYVFPTGRLLVCEEQPLKLIEPADPAHDPLVIECSHTKPVFHKEDPQVAQGEWKVEMQTPPCDDVHNLEVIWPKESGQPVSIECNAMPVRTQ